MTNPEGGAETRRAAAALGVSGLCHHINVDKNLVRGQNNRAIVQQAPRQPLGSALTGCPVINPSGRVSPGGTAQSAATEQGFRGILTGRVLSDTAGL